jgi:hypothetical protein
MEPHQKSEWMILWSCLSLKVRESYLVTYNKSNKINFYFFLFSGIPYLLKKSYNIYFWLKRIFLAWIM